MHGPGAWGAAASPHRRIYANFQPQPLTPAVFAQNNIYKPVLDANRQMIEAAEAQGKTIKFFTAAVETLGVEALEEWTKMPQSHVQVIRGGDVVATVAGPNKPLLVKAMCALPSSPPRSLRPLPPPPAVESSAPPKFLPLTRDRPLLLPQDGCHGRLRPGGLICAEG